VGGMRTIVTEVVETGEKRDARGRRVTPKDRRIELVQAYRASGMTMTAFARKEGINYPTFAMWVKAQRVEATKSPVQFVEMGTSWLASAESAGQLEVRLQDGTMVRSGRTAEVVALVKALRG